MSRRFLPLVVLLAVAIIAAAFLQMTVAAGRGGETMPLYSNRRFDPYGTAALYRVMERRAAQVVSLERPRLGDEHRGVMLQVLAINDSSWFDEHGDENLTNPYALPTSMLLDWVAQGNTLIQMTRARTAVMQELGVEFAPTQWPGIDADGQWATELQEQQLKGVAPQDLDMWQTPALWRSAEEASGPDNRLVWLNAPQPFALDGPEGWQPRLWNGGEAHGGELPHGQGRIIFVGSPSPALNHFLGDHDNLPWLTELLGDDVVVFDEWAHGVGHGGTIIETLMHFGLLPFVLQIPVWLLVYRWSTAGRRFTVDRQPRRRRSSQEQIDTLGRLLDQGWSLDEKQRRVYDEVLHRLGEACRCDAGRVESLLQSRKTQAAERGVELITQARSLATSVRPRCVSCGYEMTGTNLDNCPECGHAIPLRVRRLMKRSEFTSNAKPSGSPRWNETSLAHILNQSTELAQELKSA